MIVVTGAPRTGTSLVMQTLALLGVPMSAPKFIPQHKPIKHLCLNGYYELNLWGGASDEYKDKAIKLFGYQYFLTDEKLIDKVIHTKREKNDAVKSYEKLKKYLPKEYDVDSEKLYDANEYYIAKKKNNAIEINFKEKDDSEKYVSKIINFLNLTPTVKQITNAKNNIQCQ